jgi:plastocyanin
LRELGANLSGFASFILPASQLKKTYKHSPPSPSMKKAIFILIIIILIFEAFYLFGNTLNNTTENNTSLEENNNSSEENNNSSEEISTTNTTSQTEHTVEFTSSGYNPNALIIDKGDKVIFINKHSEDMWPASDPHPAHTDYPNSNIEKCSTPENNTIFDACNPLSQGETFNFTFNEPGVWRYHDHLATEIKGSIFVQD